MTMNIDNMKMPSGLSYNNAKNMFSNVIQTGGFDDEQDKQILEHAFGGNKSIYKDIAINNKKNNMNKSRKNNSINKKNKTHKK